MRRWALGVTMAATVALILASGQAAGATNDGTLCTPVVYSWSGSSVLGAGELFHTGSQVPADIGMQMSVDVFDVSTVDPAPNALVLSVGDSRVAAGATIRGGEIQVINDGPGPVVLTRVEISVQQCVQVAVAAPAPSVPSAPIDLPATGNAPSGVLLAACSSTIAGAALLGARRRRPRPTACDPGR